MKRTFMHFAYAPQLQQQVVPSPKTIDDFTKEIEEQVQRMIDAGTDEGMFRVTLPEGMNPEMIPAFMDEVMRRLQDRFGG